MADKLEDAEFWLPSEFLTDDDILMDKENFLQRNALGNKVRSNSNLGFPYDFGALGSPVESESDEEDLLTCLARQLTLQELHNKPVPVQTDHEKGGWLSSGSPQSTLMHDGIWSNHGSPNGPSKVSSPPLGSANDAWDLIYQAAGQVAKMKMNGYDLHARNRDLLCSHQSLTPARAPFPPKSQASGPYSSHFRGMREDQMAKQQGSLGVWERQVQNGLYVDQQVHLNRGPRAGFTAGGNLEGGKCGRQVVGGFGEPAWPAMQTQHQNQIGGSGMRAVFLGGSGAGGPKRRECAGTGVFLPRRYGSNVSDTRKKPGCSTALLPAKVVQALNKNIDDLNCYSQQQHHTQPCFNAASLVADYDILMARRNALLAQQRRNLCLHAGPRNPEFRLPQDWTY